MVDGGVFRGAGRGGAVLTISWLRPLVGVGMGEVFAPGRVPLGMLIIDGRALPSSFLST